MNSAQQIDTQKDIKGYLEQIMTVDSHINAKLSQRDYYHSLAQKTTTHWGVYGGGRENNYSRVEDYTCRLIELEGQIDREIDTLVDLRQEAMTLIATLADPRYRQVLEYRYINGWDWDKVADTMNYDRRWVMKLHGQALGAAGGMTV